MWLAIGLLAIALALCCPFRLTVVSGESMLPTLRPHQLLLMDRRLMGPHAARQWEVVVFRHQNRTYIKRVAARPGDELWILDYCDREGRPVYRMTVHPDEMERVRTLAERFPRCCRLYRKEVPDGYLYVTGDAWYISVDSRDFGLIRESDVLGRVLFVSRTPPTRDCWTNLHLLPRRDYASTTSSPDAGLNEHLAKLR